MPKDATPVTDPLYDEGTDQETERTHMHDVIFEIEQLAHDHIVADKEAGKLNISAATGLPIPELKRLIEPWREMTEKYPQIALCDYAVLSLYVDIYQAYGMILIGKEADGNRIFPKNDDDRFAMIEEAMSMSELDAYNDLMLKEQEAAYDAWIDRRVKEREEAE